VADFKEALRIVLLNEGIVFSNNEIDTGGPTKFGITKRTLSDYRGVDCTMQDVQELKAEEAALIYNKLYWQPFDLDSLMNKQSIAVAIFDQAVNRGPAACIRSLERIFGLSPSGKMTDTIKKNLDMYPELELVSTFLRDSMEQYILIVKKDARQLVFLLGWTRRIFRLLDYAVRQKLT